MLSSPSPIRVYSHIFPKPHLKQSHSKASRKTTKGIKRTTTTGGKSGQCLLWNDHAPQVSVLIKHAHDRWVCILKRAMQQGIGPDAWLGEFREVKLLAELYEIPEIKGSARLLDLLRANSARFAHERGHQAINHIAICEQYGDAVNTLDPFVRRVSAVINANPDRHVFKGACLRYLFSKEWEEARGRFLVKQKPGRMINKPVEKQLNATKQSGASLYSCCRRGY